MKVVAFEDWMVSKEHPEGVSAVIMGREWTSRTTPSTSSSSGSGAGSSGMSSQLLQDHPELLVTEVDLEEDRDREDYNSVIKAQKAKDEASNADSGIGATTSNTTSATSKDRGSAVVAVKENTLAAVSTDTRTLALAPDAEVDASFSMSMSDTTNDNKHSIKLLSSPNKQRQLNEETKRGERGGGGGSQMREESSENSLKITLSSPPKVDSSLSLSGETLERSFPGNILPSSIQSTTLHVEEEVESSGDMSMDIVHDSSVLVSALSLSSAPLSSTILDVSNSAVSTVRDVQDGVVDDAEALRKAFEDASDSDDDDDDDDDDDENENGVNNANVTSKDTESGVAGKAASDNNNNNDNNNSNNNNNNDNNNNNNDNNNDDNNNNDNNNNNNDNNNDNNNNNDYNNNHINHKRFDLC